ncbi:putative methyltransferase-domain-containing protein [Amylocystis lapponica]|nr:putative methyltransferase-domain-containing protein [Amylocystis lapponica]
MPKARKQKRKTPVTTPESAAHSTPSGSSSNPTSTRTLIRRFHVLIKRKAQLQSTSHGKNGAAKTKAELEDVERQIEELGGLGAYQRMSSIGQGNDRGGGSEKVLIEWLKDCKLHMAVLQDRNRLRYGITRLGLDRLLEVGALRPDNFAPCAAWIENTPIDLRSRHPSIQEQDFLLMDEGNNHEKWDIISLSLVLNFVPDPKSRGRMLSLACSMLGPNGLLFLALPLPCILNSRYLTPEHFDALAQVIGLSIVRTRWRVGGKMAYWLLRKSSDSPANHASKHTVFEKKTVLREGKRNNFAILL